MAQPMFTDRATSSNEIDSKAPTGEKKNRRTELRGREERRRKKTGRQLFFSSPPYRNDDVRQCGKKKSDVRKVRLNLILSFAMHRGILQRIKSVENLFLLHKNNSDKKVVHRSVRSPVLFRPFHRNDVINTHTISDGIG